VEGGNREERGAPGAAWDSVAVRHRPGHGARERCGVARRAAGRTGEGQRG
jgi:hypothetical protein